MGTGERRAESGVRRQAGPRGRSSSWGRLVASAEFGSRTRAVPAGVDRWRFVVCWPSRITHRGDEGTGLRFSHHHHHHHHHPQRVMTTTAPSKTRPKKRKEGEVKRRKVSLACVYCRRSHMTCDSERPCQRCVRRGIGHLCHDRPMNQGGPASESPAPTTAPDQPSPTSISAAAPAAAPPPAPAPGWGVLNPAMGFPPTAQWASVPPVTTQTQPAPARNWPYPPTSLAQPPAPPRNPSWFGMPPGQQQWDGAMPEANTNTNEYQMLRYVLLARMRTCSDMPLQRLFGEPQQCNGLPAGILSSPLQFGEPGST